MKEYVFEIDIEALPDLEERLLDVNPLGYAVEYGKDGVRLRVYDEGIVELLRDEGYEPEGVFESSPESWLENYLKDPFELTEGVVVDPSGVYGNGGVVLRIKPGVAFGTGIHPTTRLCAKLLVKYVKPGYDVLDVGTGTGILAILAKKLGAGRVLGVDNDPIAIESAFENTKLSGVEVEFLESDLLEKVSGRFDIVVANIVPSVLVKLSTDIGKVLKDGSLVILSGITPETVRDVKKSYSGMERLEELEEGGWIALTLRSYRNS